MQSIRIRGAGGAKSVEAASGKALAHHDVDNDLIVELTLPDCDILRIKR